MSNILIIEDDAVIRETLEYNLRGEGFTTSAAIDGSSGLDKALDEKPDVILLDLLLPNMDGISVCQELRRRGSDTRIIMITALSTNSDKIRGLTEGADDYVTKPFSFEELLARIRAQLRSTGLAGKTQPKILEFGDINLDSTKHELTVRDRIIKIRPKEWQLLMTLASNPGVLFSREQLTSLIWEVDFLGSSRTIDVHIRRLREKVEKVSRYSFIHTVHGFGYRFELVPKVEKDEV